MDYFSWDSEKNEKLKSERNISFEEIVYYIEKGQVLDILEHANKKKYPNQFIFVIPVKDYVYLVPFVERENEIFLKTIVPSRKATKQYMKGDTKVKGMTKEEKDLLDSYEKGEWKSVKNLRKEMTRYQKVARATLRKDKRINIRVPAKDLEEIQKRALEEGIPYQTLISSILHKYASGSLVRKAS